MNDGRSEQIFKLLDSIINNDDRCELPFERFDIFIIIILFNICFKWCYIFILYNIFMIIYMYIFIIYIGVSNENFEISYEKLYFVLKISSC